MPSNMETVLSTREQIESRNPLAFAPKVIRTEPGQELAVRATLFVLLPFSFVTCYCSYNPCYIIG